MLTTGPAQRVTILMGESHHYHGRSAYMAVFEFLFYHGVAGATVTRGIAGFGAEHHLHTADIITASENLPIKIEFIETPEKIGAILPKIRDLVGDGVIALQEVNIFMAPTPKKAAVAAPIRSHARLEGTAKLMRIYIGESDKWNGKPLHEALVESLRSHDIAGVTVYRGIAGFGAGRVSRDRPIMLSVVDTEEKIQAYLPLLDSMLSGGMVALSNVEVMKYIHSAAPEAGEAMTAAAQGKMMRIHIGENDRFRGRRLHEEILDRCRQARVDHATVYRGIEGYGASTLIHRPGIFGRSRDAPVVITIVDTEEKIRSLVPILDEIVDEGLIAISSVNILHYGTKG